MKFFFLLSNSSHYLGNILLSSTTTLFISFYISLFEQNTLKKVNYTNHTNIIYKIVKRLYLSFVVT